MAGTDPRIRIAEALEDLSSEDFSRFTAQMRVRREDGLQPERFRTSRVENKTYQQVADLLVDAFSDQAVSVTVRLLRAIGNNRVADDLEADADHLPAPRNQIYPTRRVPRTDPQESLIEKLESLRPTFVQKVTEPNLDQLLDHLEAEQHLNSGEVETMRGKNSRAEKAREVFNAVKNKGSRAVECFIEKHRELEPRSDLSERMRKLLSETQ